MDELFATSDVISLNCPLTPATRHLINASAFAKMKDGVFLVNTARGPVVDEEALVDALKSGKGELCPCDCCRYFSNKLSLFLQSAEPVLTSLRRNPS